MAYRPPDPYVTKKTPTDHVPLTYTAAWVPAQSTDTVYGGEQAEHARTSPRSCQHGLATHTAAVARTWFMNLNEEKVGPCP
jgi:hypothetical protein